MAFAWSLSLQAQPTFEKIYFTSSGLRFDLIELPSKNVFSALGCSQGVSRLDLQGNLIDTQCYFPDTMVGVSALRKVADNEYYFASNYVKDSCTSSGSLTLPFTHPAIGRMDSLGNVLALRHYVFDGECRNLTGNLEITADKGALICGRDSWFFAMRVDSLLSPLWAKRYTNNGGFQFVKELPGGDLLAGINMDTAGAVVTRLDPDGNVLWCKSYIRPKGVIHDAVVESDDSFIITGSTDSTSTNVFIPLPETFQPKLFMMKLNGSGEVQWCRGYDSAPNYWNTPRASRIVRTIDGNYAVLATLGHPGSNMFFRPFLMKTNLNGDTLWTRSVGSSGYDYFTMDLLASSDGGLCFSGWVWGDLPDANLALPYIFKTDSLGHVPCGQQAQSIQVLDFFPTDSSFTLASLDDVTVRPAFVNDTIFGPIAVYDACIVTTVGIRSIQDRKFRVYPNPSSGLFTVEFADPLMAESYYSVYDVIGKLLYQRPLPVGKLTEEIDLSRYGKGTYVIKFTNPNGVCYERVVVE
ncbi:MAG: T9SS type A sorting domain-containing protein [Flavobacteriales bacterium]